MSLGGYQAKRREAYTESTVTTGVLKMTKTQIKKAIRAAMGELHELRHVGSRDYIRDMHDYQRKLQRTMNNAAPFDLKADPISLVADYFVVNHLRTAWEQRGSLRPRDILHCQDSYITAHALVDAYPERVQDIMQRMDDELDLLGIHWHQLQYTCGEIIEREQERAA